MKSFLYSLFFTLSIHTLYAQLQPYDLLKNDSLLVVLKEGKTDSIRARAAFQLSKLWINNDSSKGLQYLQLGKSLSNDNDYLNAIYRYQSIPSYKDEDEVNAMLDIFRKYDNADSWDYAYRVSINRVRWLTNQPRTDEAIALLQKDILPLVSKLNNDSYKAEVNLEMGRALLNQGMNREAVPYLEKAIALYEKTHPKDNTLLYNHTYALGSLANVYNTLEINNKADSVIQRAKELLKTNPNLPQELRIASYEAMHLIQTKQYKRAEDLVNKTLAKTKGVPTRHLLNLYFQKYKAKTGMGDYLGALNLLKKSHPIDSIQLNPSKFGAVNLNELLPAYADAHEKAGDYKQASMYWKRSIKHRDSVNKDQIAEELSKLEIQLRTQEKDAAIHHLTAERSKTSLRLKNQRMLIGLFVAVAGLLLTVLGFILYIYRSRQRTNAARIQQLETDSKFAVIQALLEGEERERQRIGRDLHDSLGGALSGIRIKLSESYLQNAESTLNHALEQLEDAISEVRRIARNMVPESLLCSGLDTALQDLCVAFSSDTVKIEYQSAGLTENLAKNIQTHIYRIVQELLANATKHGAANNIIVQCIQNENTLLLTVEDNGRGFSIQKAHSLPGIGLKNIQHRVEYMQGEFNMESELGQGTTIYIEINVS